MEAFAFVSITSTASTSACRCAVKSVSISAARSSSIEATEPVSNTTRLSPRADISYKWVVFGGWGTPEIPLTAMAMSPSQPAANMVSSLTMYISWDMTTDKHKHSISAALPATGVETGVWTA